MTQQRGPALPLGGLRPRPTWCAPASVTSRPPRCPTGGRRRGLEALLTEIERVGRHGFTATELERAKLERHPAATSRPYAERDKLDSATFAAEYVRNFLDGEPRSPASPYEHAARRRGSVPGDHARRGQRPRRQVDLGRRTASSSVAAPAKPPVPSQRGRCSPPYSAGRGAGGRAPTSTAPSTARWWPRRRRRARSSRSARIPELGVTEWRLSNGVTRGPEADATSRTTRSCSPASARAASRWSPDAAYLSGSLAASLVRQGGLGRSTGWPSRRPSPARRRTSASYIGD